MNIIMDLVQVHTAILNGSRRSNIGPLKKYMNQIENGNSTVFEEHEVSKVEQMEEEMFLGLRKTEGVSISTFHSEI